MKKLIHKIAKFIFPSHCVVCDTVGTLLCQACRDDIPFTLVIENIHGYQTASAVSYKNKYLKKLIWYAKYKRSLEAKIILARLLEEAIMFVLEDSQEIFLPATPIILIPVPMTKKHERARGGNHLETIIDIIIKNNPGQFTSGENLVTKIKSTKTQVECRTRADRLINLKDAFQVTEPEAFAGRVVCLIDDLVTTGTTCTEMFKVLEKARPKLLVGATIAHG